MKYYLDFGSHRFGGLEEFEKSLGINKEWKVICYEANPFVFQEALILKSKFSFNIDLINKAVLNKNDKITFNAHNGAWIDQNFIEKYDTGSNCLSINPKIDHGNGAIFNINQVEVDTCDVLEIINDICNKDNSAELFIKCDIEGSEFIVLPRILESDNVRNIKEIHIEWHERFWLNTDEYISKVKDRQLILENFKNLGIFCAIHG